ncbi:MAG: hypothetical protein EOP48_19515 [Sphingobacteriales bacterium]|nr:MAG: hypothetical protein EOP48_19515 [Sphingobacteriales bacterium]
MKNKNDTISLFNRSLIYYAYNQMLAQPYQRTKGTLENLTKAKDQIEKAIENGMKDFRAKQLRAQIYCELCYRFTGDESWMFIRLWLIPERRFSTATRRRPIAILMNYQYWTRQMLMPIPKGR